SAKTCAKPRSRDAQRLLQTRGPGNGPARAAVEQRAVHEAVDPRRRLKGAGSVPVPEGAPQGGCRDGDLTGGRLAHDRERGREAPVLADRGRWGHCEAAEAFRERTALAIPEKRCLSELPSRLGHTE